MSFRARAEAACGGVCGEAPTPGSKAAISELVEEVAAVMHETACLLVAGSIVLSLIPQRSRKLMDAHFLFPPCGWNTRFRRVLLPQDQDVRHRRQDGAFEERD